MNKWKLLAIVFTLFTLGAFKETLRIFTSSEPDIASNRKELMIMAVILTSVFVYFTIRFWKKASDKRLY
jgi:hypothetical protein